MLASLTLRRRWPVVGAVALRIVAIIAVAAIG
jgi:hypothetical protein